MSGPFALALAVTSALAKAKAKAKALAFVLVWLGRRPSGLFAALRIHSLSHFIDGRTQ